MIALGLAALAVLVTVAVVSSGGAAKPSELLVTVPSDSGLEQGGGDGGSSARRVVCRATGSQQWNSAATLLCCSGRSAFGCGLCVRLAAPRTHKVLCGSAALRKAGSGWRLWQGLREATAAKAGN